MDAVTDKSYLIQNDIVEDLIDLGFCQANKPSLAPAIESTRPVQYEPGDTLYHEKSHVEFIHIIRDGRVKMLNYLENGRSRIVRLHNRGSIIGLNGMVDEPYTHTAIAIDDVNVYQVPIHLIKSIKDNDPESYCVLLEYWHEYLSMADTWITEFSTGAIRGRVARLILFLIENDNDTGPKDVTLLTVEEMADILGVTPESVSRVMAEFKRKKVLCHIDDDAPDLFRCDTAIISREAGH